MAEALTPFETWPEGATEPQTIVNQNFLRWLIGQRNVNNATTAQPGSPSDGDCYIIQSTHTGAQWATFTPKSIAIYKGGTWIEFTPTEGFTVKVSGVLYTYTSGAWVAGGGATDRSAVSALSTSGTVNIDCSLGDYFTLALAGNVTSITFSNLPASGKAMTLAIRITQDSTARTVAWPSSFKWAGGSVPAVSTGSGAVDELSITTFNQGTSWHAVLGKAFA